MRTVIKLPSREVSQFEVGNAMRHLLIESVDAYCMFCESPLTADIPVSHRVLESSSAVDFTFGETRFSYSAGVGRHRRYLEWENWQLACAACVSAKGNSPGSREGFERMRATAPSRFAEMTGNAHGKLRLTPEQQDFLYVDALNSWVWPDEACNHDGLILLPGDPTWDLFTFEESSVSQVELSERGLVRLQDNEKSQAWATERKEQLWVVPNTGFINGHADPSDMLDRVMSTIRGWNLNYFNPTDEYARDRRVDNRTAALRVAETALEKLQAAVQHLKDTQSRGDEDLEHPDVAALLAFIREALRSTGFWSVWARRFVLNIYPPIPPNSTETHPLWSTYSRPARRLLLYQLFVEYEIDRRAPVYGLNYMDVDQPPEDDESDEDVITRMVLSGTDLNRLPF